MTTPREQACARSVRVHLAALHELESTLEGHESQSLLVGARYFLDAAAAALEAPTRESWTDTGVCDECRGSGYYRVSGGLRECVCWPETLLGSMCVACGAEP